MKRDISPFKSLLSGTVLDLRSTNTKDLHQIWPQDNQVELKTFNFWVNQNCIYPWLTVLNLSRDELAHSATFILQAADALSAEIEGRTTFDLFKKSEIIIDSKYQIQTLIGEGGMGAVYKARHMQLQKDVALKTFRTHRFSLEAWQRFQREAQAIGRLHHKNIVEVFDFGVAKDDGLPYYTMTLLEGESLAQRLKKYGHLNVVQALGIFLQVAEALEHAHNNNIVHRDIKPGNIFLEQPCSNNRVVPIVKLVDFGIAKLAVVDQDNLEKQALTEPGTIFGSPLYMSPEQINGKAVDHRSDVYSFGCALFETITGEVPFISETAFATMLCHLNKDLPVLHDIMGEAMPPRLDIVIMRLMSKNPDRRYQSFKEVQSDLRFCLKAAEKRAQGESHKQKRLMAFDEGNSVAGTRDRFDLFKGYAKVSVLSLAVFLCGFWLFSVLLSAPHPNKAKPTQFAESNLDKLESEKLLNKRASAAASKEKFLVEIKPDGSKRYEFPDYAAIGTFDGASGHSKFNCRNELIWPPGPKPKFETSEEIYEEPRLFQRFNHDDIRELVLAQPMDEKKKWNIDKLQYAYNLRDLSAIDLSAGSFDRSALPLIDKHFPNLSQLGISDTHIKGSELAETRLLMRLSHLNAANVQDMSPFFKQAAELGGKSRLCHLNVEGCVLSEEDLKNIGFIKSLKYLNAKKSAIRGGGLLSLAENSNLRELNLDSNPIDSRYLKAFAKFKNLRSLSLKNITLDQKQKEEIQNIQKTRKDFHVYF